MDSHAIALTGELRDRIAANRIVDPRDMPIRHHNLRAIGRSPAHYLESFQDGRSSTMSMRIGSGTHGLLLGKEVVLYPGKVRNGKVWDAFEKEHAERGAVILNAKELAKATAMNAAVRAHETANRVLFCEGTVHERTILWEQMGRKCRTTPDAASIRHLVEVKTTKCADPARFVRDAMFAGYHAQLANQADALEYQNGIRPKDVYVVAIENTAPYVVEVFRLTPNALEQGARLNRLWLERALSCEAAGTYPGYSQCISDFDVSSDDLDLIFGDDSADSEGE